MEKAIDILVEISIYSAIITVSILLFRAAFKKRLSPGMQYILWFVLVLRLMLPFTIQSSFHIDSMLPVAVSSENPQGSFSQEASASIEASLMTETSSADAIHIIPESPSGVIQNQNNASVINWRPMAFRIWISGIIPYGAWLLLVKLRFYKDIKKHLVPTTPGTLSVYKKCCMDLNVVPITIWTVDRAISPGIVFFTRPVLLLPASMERDTERLRYALLHELFHKKRGDHYTTALLTFLRIVYWFNPAVHIGFNEMRSDMETVCDANVIAFIGPNYKQGYLSAVLQSFSYSSLPQLGMSRASSRRMAERRIKSAFMRCHTTAFGKASAFILVLAMLICCFTTACQATPPESTNDPVNPIDSPLSSDSTASENTHSQSSVYSEQMEYGLEDAAQSSEPNLNDTQAVRLANAASTFLTIYFDNICEQHSALSWALPENISHDGQLIITRENQQELKLLSQWVDYTSMLADFGYDAITSCGRFTQLYIISMDVVSDTEENEAYALTCSFETTAFTSTVCMEIKEVQDGLYGVSSVTFPEWTAFNDFRNDFISYMSENGWDDYGKSMYVDNERKKLLQDPDSYDFPG